MTTISYFWVRSVMLDRAGGAALTLAPETWVRDSPTETEMFDGEEIPALEFCEPTTEGATPLDQGGKMTELRYESDPGWRPGDHLAMSVTAVA